MKNSFRRRPSWPLLLLFSVALIFIVLYGRFLTGDAVYLYTDIGSDSVSSSFPILVFLQKLFRTRDFSAFHLQAGLGADITQLMLKYLNPLKLPLLFFTKDTLPAGLMLARFLETAATAVFSYGFFHILTGQQAPACAAALCFSFSGYVTLWSQNLTIGSCMAVFALCMYLFARALKLRTVRSFLLLAGGLALFVVTNYYFTWMTGAFMILFLLVRQLAARNPGREFFRDTALTAACACGALLLSCFAAVQIYTGLTGSVRSADLTARVKSAPMQSPKTLLTSFGRLFSVNAAGVGSSYTGGANYYEAAVLSSSILVLFAVFYLLAKKRTRAASAAVIAVSVLMLTFRKAGQLLQFNGDVQRFSFMITFAGVAGLALFLKDLSGEPERRPLLISAVLAPALTAAAPFLLKTFGSRYGIQVYTRAFKEALLFALLYAALICSALFLRAGKKILMPALLLLIAAELTVINYDTLFFRSYLTKEAYAGAASLYGTEEAAESAKEQDDSLYRISASADTFGANAGMLLDRPALSVYLNANPASLESLARCTAVGSPSQNHMDIGWNSCIPMLLMGGRYCILNNDGLSVNQPPSSLFEKISVTADGGKAVWRLRNAPDFGYVYTDEMDSGAASALPAPERLLAMTRAYFLTDPADSGSAADAAAPPVGEEDFTVTDLRDRASSPSDLKAEETDGVLRLSKTGGDPYLFFDIGRGGGSSPRFLYIRCRGLKSRRSLFSVYPCREGEGPDPACRLSLYLNGDCPEGCILLPDDTAQVRLDPPKGASRTDLEAVSLYVYAGKEKIGEPLLTSGASDIRFERDTWSGTVSSEGGMLCVPVLWSGCWTASVDGSAAAVENINGGLCGIRVPSGTVSVSMTWKRPGTLPGLAVSILSAAVWIFLMLRPDGRGASTRRRAYRRQN